MFAYIFQGCMQLRPLLGDLALAVYLHTACINPFTSAQVNCHVAHSYAKLASALQLRAVRVPGSRMHRDGRVLRWRTQFALGAATRAMADAAINKRLRRRVLTFQASTLSCAPSPLAMTCFEAVMGTALGALHCCMTLM